MPIWSLTAERIKKLESQIEKKKVEHDDLLSRSEKDLWCADLDEFIDEWRKQLVLDAEIQTNIKRMGRRRSQKIGAGKSKGRPDDDDYDPGAKKGRGRPGGTKAVVAKVAQPAKSQQRFAETWAGAKAKAKDSETDEVGGSDGFSDDDFMALGRSKAPSVKPKEESVEPSASDAPAPARGKRAAAKKPKAWVVDDSDGSDGDDKMLGDVGAMVKGIGGGAKAEDKTSGRLSLFAMSRGPDSQGPGLAKTIRTKPSRTFDFDSHDDTNYEMLAKSSPRKSVKGDEIDNLLSDDDDDDGFFQPTKITSKPSTSSQPAPKASAATAALGVKKPRGRPAGSKSKSNDKPAKPTGLSPAAKAYAAKKAVKKNVVSDDDDDEPVVKKQAARGRPARTAAKSKPAKTYVIESDSDEEIQDVAGSADEDDSDPFAMDDSE
jgi:DNA topoisomerase II